jgi:endonuclease YncB( thermonuclease family)
MEFTVIKGTFQIVGYEPDGDSVRFKADNFNNWSEISGKAKMNKDKLVQLRIEGIDALETHYFPGVKGAARLHQPLKYALSARDFLLNSLGFQNVKFNPKNKMKVESAISGSKGYILTHEVDNSQYGRPVSFLFTSENEFPDGSTVELDEKLLEQSINYKSIVKGYSYPTFYKGLSFDLRLCMTKAVQEARKKKYGIWLADKTPGITFNNLKSITNDNVLFPKLFRRLAEHTANGGKLSDFKSFLSRKKDDGVYILSLGHHTNGLDYLIEIKGNLIGMKFNPEDLLFDGKK